MGKSRRQFAFLVMSTLLVFAGYHIGWATISVKTVIAAAETGNINVIRRYLRTSPNPKSQTFQNAFRETIYSAREPYGNYRRIVGLFVDHGADPTEALRYAIVVNNPEIAKEAIRKGAVCNKRYSTHKDTPLSHAIRARDFEIVKILRLAGAKR